MTEHDVLQMMKRCKSEIESLRRANNELAPRAHAYETISKMMDVISPDKPQGHTEDIAWMLQKEIDAMEKAKATTQEKAE